MAVRPIPEGSIEIQTGLWAAENWHPSFSGDMVMHYTLYSSEGYCFWEVNQPENYDEEGNLKPLEQRVFAQYAITAYSTISELNENFISVSYEEGYEVVSVPVHTETE